MKEAVLLLTVGMTTVFVALFVVVIVGNVLIRVINRFFPEEVKKQVKKTFQNVSQAIDPKKMAAITSAVDIATGGRGKVVKIEKV